MVFDHHEDRKVTISDASALAGKNVTDVRTVLGTDGADAIIGSPENSRSGSLPSS